MKSHFIAYAAMAVALLAEAPVLRPSPFGLTDHLVIWYVGLTIANGGSPYETATWVDAATRYGSAHIQEILDYGASVWPYPPWTGYLFVPFGLLPVSVGPWVLHAAYVLVGLGAAIAFARMLPWRSPSAIVTALTVFAVFQPFVIAARWGQFSSFVLAGFVLLFAGMTSRRTPLIVIGVLLLVTKPQLTALLGPIVLVVLIRKRAWRTLGALAVVVGGVVALTWLRYPEWVNVAASGSAVRVGLLEIFASTWAFAVYVGGEMWPFVGAALVLTVLGCAVLTVLWSPGGLRLASALAGALLVGLALVPLAHSYDHLLLAPALFIALLALDRSDGAARVTHALAIVVLAVAIPWAAFIVSLSGPSQAVSGIVPILFAFLLVASAALLRRDDVAERAVAPAAD